MVSDGSTRPPTTGRSRGSPGGSGTHPQALASSGADHPRQPPAPVRPAGSPSVHLLRESLFSVFVDNIPIDKDVRWLRSLFNKDGVTMDGFIPLKGRKVSSSRFGFVRYKTLEEAKAAIRRWNGTQVGNGTLSVKLADNGGKPLPRTQSPNLVPRKFLWTSRGGKEWNSEPIETLFKASKFSGSNLIKKRRIKVEEVPKHAGWFRSCAVGELKVFVSVEQLEVEMRQEGIAFDKVISMGGLRILTHFAKLDDLESWLTEDHQVKSLRFSKIQRWSEEDLPSKRSVWLSVTGLPFSVWSEGTLMKIAEPFGQFIRMDDRDLQLIGLSRVRFMVETNEMGRLSEVLEAQLGDKVFTVYVCEECLWNGCETKGHVTEAQSEWSEDNLSVVNSEIKQGEGVNPSSLGSPPSPALEEQERAPVAAAALSQEAGNEVEGTRANGQESEEPRSRPSSGSSGHSVASKVKVFGGANLEKRKSTLGVGNRRGVLSQDDRRVQIGQPHEESLSHEVGSLVSHVDSFKALKFTRRRESKEKGIIKYKRRKEKGVLDGLKRAYMRKLENSRRLDQDQKIITEGVEELQSLVGISTTGDLRREAELTWELGKELGLEADAPDEEVIQMFMDMEARRVHSGQTKEKPGDVREYAFPIINLEDNMTLAEFENKRKEAKKRK